MLILGLITGFAIGLATTFLITKKLIADRIKKADEEIAKRVKEADEKLTQKQKETRHLINFLEYNGDAQK